MIRIKRADKVDIDNIVNLRNALDIYHRKFDKLLNTDFKRKQYNKRLIKSKIKSKNAILLVALDKNKIIGYALGWIEKRPAHAFRIGYFCDIFIIRNYRNKGIGKKLIKGLMNWFKSKKIKYVTLDVYSKNKTAIKAFYSIGFKELSRHMRMRVR